MYVCMYVYVCIYVYVYVYIYMYLCVSAHVFMCIHSHVCVCMCICAYMYYPVCFIGNVASPNKLFYILYLSLILCSSNIWSFTVNIWLCGMTDLCVCYNLIYVFLSWICNTLHFSNKFHSFIHSFNRYLMCSVWLINI